MAAVTAVVCTSSQTGPDQVSLARARNIKGYRKQCIPAVSEPRAEALVGE